MKKPTILVFAENEGQSESLVREYQNLKKTYDLLFLSPTHDLSPFLQADRIVHDLKRRRIRLDGVVAFLDLDAEVAAIIAEKLRLPGPTPKAIFLAQNKVEFSRLMQKEHFPYPETEIIDLATNTNPRLPYPLFIRPIKSSFSANSYILRSKEEWQNIREQLLQKKMIVEQSYTAFFSQFGVDKKKMQTTFVCQRFINAKQFNADGFVYSNQIHLLGITQAIYTANRKSFKRFDFPARLPKKAITQLTHTLNGITQLLHYNNSGINVEFFLLPDDTISIIEVNTRIARQFFPLFQKWYEMPTFQMMVDLSQGKKPNITLLKKRLFASSFPLRVLKNCAVKRVPTQAEIGKLKKQFDIENINIYVKEGTRLSDYRQDAYSYRYGVIDIAGKNLIEIKQKFALLMKNLPLQLEPIDENTIPFYEDTTGTEQSPRGSQNLQLREDS